MKLELQQQLLEIASQLSPDAGGALSLELVPPKNPDHGDLSSVVAFRLCKILKKSPLACAEQLLPLLEKKILS